MKRPTAAVILAQAALWASGSGYALAAQHHEAQVISGLVTDSLNQPLSHVRVCLTDEEEGRQHAVFTDKHGRFTIDRSRFQRPVLLVNADQKRGMAAARIANIPGTGSRQFIIRLRRGFHVTGRVVYEGTGVKDLTVSALPVDIRQGARTQDQSAIHGGGGATTDKSGRFSLLLTPGEKVLVVSNHVYSDLPERVEVPITVTSDVKLPDVVIPSRQ